MDERQYVERRRGGYGISFVMVALGIASAGVLQVVLPDATAWHVWICLGVAALGVSVTMLVQRLRLSHTRA